MIGIDVVDIARLRNALERRPRLAERLFSKRERSYCESFVDPVVHLAGTLAAKEAVIKALDLGSLASRAGSIEILRNKHGAPHALIHDHPAGTGISITHDGGIAAAVALVNR